MIERLHSGGTLVVLNNAADPAAIRKAFRTTLLTGPVTRLPTRLNRGFHGAT